MHSCKMITNLHAKKVLCHHVEVVNCFSTRNSPTANHVAENTICGCSTGNSINVMKPRNRPKVTRPFFPRERAGSGHETRLAVLRLTHVRSTVLRLHSFPGGLENCSPGTRLRAALQQLTYYCSVKCIFPGFR